MIQPLPKKPGQPALRWRALALAAGLVLAMPAAAHDTWFRRLPAPAGGGVALALGTGNQFPTQESAVGMEHLARSGCRDGNGAVTPLAHAGDTPTALLVATTTATPRSCWAQLAPHEVTLAPDQIALYLREIQAPQAVRATWASMQARGLAWQERYTKHARIDFGSPSGVGADAPTDMALDVRLERIAPDPAGQNGDIFVFQVLRDGLPLPDFAVELRSDVSRFGVWRKTDDAGRVRIKLTVAGRWVLRGTDLRPSDTNPEGWESRFVTLAFEVGAVKEKGLGHFR